jgi:hypothetical protein
MKQDERTANNKQLKKDFETSEPLEDVSNPSDLLTSTNTAMNTISNNQSLPSPLQSQKVVTQMNE